MTVTWKKIVIPGIKNIYKVSSDGRVKNTKSGNIIKQHLRGAYLSVPFYKPPKSSVLKCVHVLVGEAFIRKREKNEVVNHKNGNKLDNRLENLEVVDKKYNSKHGVQFRKKSTARPVRQMYLNNIPVKDFASAMEATRLTGVTINCVRRACVKGNGIAGGYRWRYLDDADEFFKEKIDDYIKEAKQIPGFKDFYATKCGRIINLKRKKFAAQIVDDSGYIRVKMTKKKICKMHSAHRLIALTFLKNPLNKTRVNHEDSNKANNNVKNLEWVTPSGNTQHWADNRTENSRCMPVNQLDSKGKIIATFKSVSEASKQTKVDYGGIVLVCKGEQALSGGFDWEYVKK
jgi:hypothetical protein